MTNKTIILDKVKSYNGSNDFIRKMSETLHKWGRLTEKQYSVVEKLVINEDRTKEVDVESLPQNSVQLSSTMVTTPSSWTLSQST